VSQLHEEIKELSENHGEYECYNLLPKCLNHIEQLEKENTKLKQQIEKMKCCGNCNNDETMMCGECNPSSLSKWELKVKDL
jgi:uncharacterized coiled-coil DUF342 family protein